MSDDKIQQAITRAAQAERLLNDELLQECMAKIEKELIEEFLKTNFRDQDARERIWLAINRGRKYNDMLRAVIENGKVAKFDLNEITARNKLRAV